MHQVEQLSTFSAPAQAPALAYKSFITTNSVDRVHKEKYPSREAETMGQCLRLDHHLPLYLDQLMKVRGGRVSYENVLQYSSLCAHHSLLSTKNLLSFTYKQKKKNMHVHYIWAHSQKDISPQRRGWKSGSEGAVQLLNQLATFALYIFILPTVSFIEYTPNPPYLDRGL
jgi:hypothetical protein